MTEKLITARRAVSLPWIDDGRYYDLVTGRGTTSPQMAKSPTAFRCMQIRGTELANIPWHIKRDDKILKSHPLIDMLREFGPESNYNEAMLSTEMDRLSFGAGLWLRDVDILKRLDPNTIKVNKTAFGISSFTQTINGKETVFKRDEVVYFREYHPEDQLGFGIPIMEVVKKSINAEIETLLMIEAYFRNDAIPGFLLTTEQDVTESEAERVIGWWKKLFRGSRKKFKVGIAGKGLKPVPVGSSMKDNAILDILESAQNDICLAMGIPHVLVGQEEEATYVNLAESRKFLIEDTIMPRSMEYQNVINHDLVQQVDTGVVFEFAFDEMQILQEDSTLKQSRLTEALGLGIISDDYYREEMGYPADSKPKESDKAAVAEDKWERKALKALVRGDSPDVSFETDNIEIDRRYLLHGRLMNAKTKEAVRACFA